MVQYSKMVKLLISQHYLLRQWLKKSVKQVFLQVFLILLVLMYVTI